ncbi:hypothetical protein PDN20_30450 [Bacillus cereus]|nr:hypothetical protein [Bacillus cereus]MDA2130828.1 hypothetical protein [Bacillus cereus]MDA2152887.1 hypothetical protein [Bacillus cereus]MDA2524537.1 hypothetical protein [Bacillus cereus]MEB9160396.1 hypothetical protein [Bacillus cereus]
MAFRTKETKTYTTIVICDDCGKERVLCCATFDPLGFNEKMNGALSNGYMFKQEGNHFKNYCGDCKEKHK